MRRGAAMLALLAACIGADARTVAVTGAKVHTLGPLGTLESATIVIEDGVITAIGEGLEVPAGATAISVDGAVVTPGLFDAYSYIGAVEVTLAEDTVDVLQRGTRFTAGFDVGPAINPRSTLIPVNRIEGITHAVVAPQPALEGSDPISGLGAAINLGGGDDFLVEPRVALFAQLGKSGASLAGGSRASALLALREALEDARDFARHRGAWEDGRRRAYSVGRLDLEALQAVLEREIPLVVTAHRASDILSLLELAAEERIDVVVAGGGEAWLVADALAAARVPVLLDPTRNLPAAFETLHATLENAARLDAAGVKVAFTISDSHNARNIRQLAGNAVANGMSWEGALRAVTVAPAEIYGIDSVGALEVGKRASLVVWDGDPLEVTTFASRVYIDGAAVPMRSRQTLLRDRYRELERPLPHAYERP